MRDGRRLRIATSLAVAAATIAADSLATLPAQGADTAVLGCEAGKVEKSLANGAAWRMCARIHPIKGLVLESIEFKPASGSYEYEGYKRVLDEVYLAQLNVPYDSGSSEYDDIPEFGFGDAQLMEQGPKLCGGETMNISQAFMFRGELLERTMPGICIEEVDLGLATHSQEAELGGGAHVVEQGSGIEVSSVSKVSWYEYQQKVTFGDQGQIDVALGATGDVGPGGSFFSGDPSEGWPLGPPVDGHQEYAVSHWHNAIYRVDFAVDSGTRQTVEQWDYTQDGAARAPVVRGMPTPKSEAFSSIPGEHHDELTWWRVVNPESLNKDGHPRSYEIVNQNQTDRFSAITQPAVSFTNDHSCQEYAVGNLHPDCPNQTVLDYVAAESAPLTDPVAWVNVGFHHIDRDEDQSPMPVHWQRFQLVPRDFFAQQPSITPTRQCINGFLEGGVDSAARPCIATNQRPPTISADAAPIVPGTVLTADPGMWNTSRTTWDYAYRWYRNGKPILSATQKSYRVTAADHGAKVTVRVTAWQTGFPSGTADSASVTVAAAPKSLPSMHMSSPRGGMYGRAGAVTVSVAPAATGRVSLTLSGKPLGSHVLVNGRTSFVLARTIDPGRWSLRANYAGSNVHHPVSRTVVYTVAKAPPRRVRLKVERHASRRSRHRVVVRVEQAPGLRRATGRITLVLSRGGKDRRIVRNVGGRTTTIVLPRLRRGTWKVKATYSGDARYRRQTSPATWIRQRVN